MSAAPTSALRQRAVDVGRPAPDRAGGGPLFAAASLAVVALAGALRFWGIDFGLPHLEARPDETETLQLTLLAAGGEFDFDWAIYPHAYVYLQWAWASLVLGVQSWLGIVPDADMQAVWDREPERLYAIGRWLSALGGTATVAVVIATARRELGAAVALVAGLFLAVNLLHVRESHALKPDCLLTLGTALCLAGAAALARRGDLRTGVLAGVAVGLAAAMKYNGVLGALAVATGAWLAPRPGDATLVRRWLPPSLVAAGVAAAATFALTSPFLLFNEAAQAVIQSNLHAVFPQWIERPASAAAIDVSGLEGPGLPGWVVPWGPLAAVAYHAGFSLWYGVGAVATLLAPFAVGYGLASRAPLLRASAVFAVGWYVVIAISPVTLSRYVTPMLPALALLEAALVAGLAHRITARSPLVAVALAAVVLLAQPAWASVRFDRLLARSDTRAEAHRWLEANARGHRVAFVGTRFWHWGEPRAPKGVRRAALPPSGAIDPRRVDFVVTHDHELYWSQVPAGFEAQAARRLDLLVDLDPRRGAGGDPVFEWNDAYYLPVAGFGGVSAPGPHVRIYRTR